MSSVMSSSTVSEDDSEILTDPARVFAESLVSQVNRDDVVNMVHLQREMLSRFEKTNEMLINFNMLSTARFDVTCQEFKKHTSLLFDMKKDLDAVFKRIRVLKQRLGKMYPEAFTVCSDVYNFIENEEEEEREEKESSVITPTDETKIHDKLIKTPTDTPKTPSGLSQKSITIPESKETSQSSNSSSKPQKETLKSLSETASKNSDSSKTDSTKTGKD